MSVYDKYSEEQLEELYEGFLVDSWSYSKVSQFSRNEKGFEMLYIYGHKTKRSSTTIAGQAYHFALSQFFESFKDGEMLDLATLEIMGFNYLDEVPAFVWKIQKTTPTVEDCKIKATKTVASLLKNFVSEVDTYADDVAEILDVEVRCEEFLTVNGVDIPMPCHCYIDLVVRLHSGKVVVIDHKSRVSFSNEQELKFSIGTQAMTYVMCYEKKTGTKVDAVWFVENKYSQNRDKSPQLNAFKIDVDKDVRKLYEAILYEPLRRMISAVQDPDYVYMINDSDNFIDKAEIYDFWAKTMIAEVEEFNVADSKKKLVAKRLKKIRDASISIVNPVIIKNFKESASEFIQYDLSNKNMTPEQKIEHVLRTFAIIVRVAHKFDGYSSNTYLLEISAGVKINSIHKHRLDIANALDVSNVRITKDLVLHDGKSYIGIEFSKQREKDLLFDASYSDGYKIPIGVDNYGNTVTWDLKNHSTPHMLICGATGSGKSVCIKSTIEYAKLAGVDDIVVLDPKYEFLDYAGTGNTKVFNEIIDIEEEMEFQVKEMNALVKSGKKRTTLIVFDEFADAVSGARSGHDLNVYEMVQVGEYKGGRPKTKRELIEVKKSLEENLKILLQKGRSSGFRIISATQRASVKVITGDAKVNFPVQVCFRVPKETDSRVVLDEAGAESLAGKGDGLIRSPEYPDLVRFQAFYTP